MAQIDISKFLKNAVVISESATLRNELRAKLAKFSIETSNMFAVQQAYGQMAKARGRCDLIICDDTKSAAVIGDFVGNIHENQRFKNTLVLLIIGKDKTDEIWATCQNKIHGYLFKPLLVDQLIPYLEYLLSVYEIYQENIDVLAQICRAQYELGKKSYYNVISIYENIVAQRESAAICFALGKAYRLAEDHGKAMDAFNKVKAIDPSWQHQIHLFLNEYPIDKNRIGSGNKPIAIPKEAIDAFAAPISARRPIYGIGRMRTALLAITSTNEREMVKGLLTLNGVGLVESVSTGAEILQKASTMVIDLLITDYKLTDNNAVQLAASLHALPKHEDMTIICCFDAGDQYLVNGAMEAGITGICIRPLNTYSLVLALDLGAISRDLARFSGDAAIHLKTAWYYFFNNEIEEFLQHAGQALQIASDDPMAVITRAMGLDIGRERAAANEVFAVAISINKKLEPMVANLKKYVTEVLARNPELKVASNQLKQQEQQSRTGEKQKKKQEGARENIESQSSSGERSLVYSRVGSPKDKADAPAETSSPFSTRDDLDEWSTGPTSDTEQPDASIIASGDDEALASDPNTNENHQELVDIDFPVVEKKPPPKQSDTSIPKETTSAALTTGDPGANTNYLNLIANIIGGPKQSNSSDRTARIHDSTSNAADPFQATFEVEEEICQLKPTIDNCQSRENLTSTFRVAWMSPATLDASIHAGKSGEQEIYGAQQLVRQALLMNSRMIATKASGSQNSQFGAYETAMGFQFEKILPTMNPQDIDETMLGRISEAREKLRKNTNNPQLAQQLGALCLEAGLVDQLFQQVLGAGSGSLSGGAFTIIELFAQAVQHLQIDADLVAGYFVRKRSKLIDQSLQLDGGKAIMRALIVALGVKPFMVAVNEEPILDAFLDDLRHPGIARMFAQTLRTNIEAVKFLQLNLPEQVDLNIVLSAAGDHTENIFDIIKKNHLGPTFWQMVDYFSFDQQLLDGILSHRTSLRFIDPLVKNTTRFEALLKKPSPFDKYLLSHLLLQGHGAAATTDLFRQGGASVIDDTLRSTCAPNIIIEALPTVNTDELLQELIIAYGHGALFTIMRPNRAAVQILQEHVDKDATLDTLMHLDKGKKIFEKVIGADRSRALFTAISHGNGAEVLAAQVFRRGQTRELLLNVLQNASEKLQEQFASERDLAMAVLNLGEPIRALHSSLWQDKQESHRLLIQLSPTHRRNMDADRLVTELNAILTNDNYAIDTFKKCYQLLLDHGLASKAAEFFKSHEHLYIVHGGLRDFLYELLKSRERDNSGLIRDFLKKACNLNKDDYYYLKEMATSALKAGELSEVPKWVDKMLKVNPELGEAYNLAAIACKRGGQLDRAIQWYQRGIARDGKNVKLHYNLAIVYAAIGDNGASLESMQRSRQLQNGEKKPT